ncbi:MAG: tRNA-(ms[2]io[6]A)-hydroxylase [Moraxellaceae bacterium]|nr:tRNA-(ms[2]io[6]A)-hydroxylase [Moraxellaceae bacterium]MBP8852275.1 tRNA-(ms[2]io[6]A)-hydroxylase [Moraxellaceae bacterium]MBP9046427.1 tRNA-(ms[2]io[6]A)-hydroxylase [Moraxellaceae bacterium]MBP9731175.1 tRNA-(ms[2]io[6]A)-hydroxylase [Moraxellaceae bacterium]HQV41666.1 tRNA-(ms[2]io[6]A)-hydroxylase [Moraxellaceae bacterium]
MDFLEPVRAFLACPTPDRWVQGALADIPLILQDHANCEKKAASTAMNLLFRYSERQELQVLLSQLVREEMLHYEQVLEIMQARGIPYRHVSAARYATGLREHVRHGEPDRLVDILIVGAFVEARSCERFEKIAPHLDAELSRFYTFLLRSEARHFEYYLDLARQYSPVPIEDRIALFRDVEADLILRPDTEVRFHSGPVDA